MNVDVLKWSKENAHEFPSIALIARVYLSRELTSSYQEHIFSNGAFIPPAFNTTGALMWKNYLK